MTNSARNEGSADGDVVREMLSITKIKYYKTKDGHNRRMDNNN